jgi:hypothetical protein
MGELLKQFDGSMRAKALGTIIEWSGAELTPSDFYSGMLDYWDH